MKFVYNGVDLLDVFGLIGSLEVFYVLEGLKQVCRLSLEPTRTHLLKSFCKRNNLHIFLSDHKIISRPDPCKDGFSSNCTVVPLEDSADEYWAYISKSKATAEEAKYMEQTGDEAGFGKLLGYPDCCIRFFEREKTHRRYEHMDLTMAAVRKTGPFPFYNNRALKPFGYSLISHFPCSLGCKSTEEIAKRYLASLKDCSPYIASLLERHLKSFVIYTETRGVFYSYDYELVDNSIIFRDLNATIKNERYYQLNEAGQIDIVSQNELLVGSMLLKGDDIALLVFN